MRKRFGKRFNQKKSRSARRPGPSLRSETLEPRYALTAEAIGDAFEVNDFLAGEQSVDRSSVAVATSDTNRVVVWQGRGPTDRSGVFARVFDQDGQALGDSFRVNTTVRGEQHSPAVATAADGSFTVVWAGRGFADKDGVYLQRFDSQGAAIGGEVPVNVTLGGVQTAPTIAMDDDGSFIVGWEGVGRGDASGVFFRRFNPDGALAGEVRANETVDSRQQGASVAILSTGEFAVGWQSLSRDGSGWNVLAQRYNSAALPLGTETVLSTTTAGDQTNLSLAAHPVDGFVAAWQSFGQDGDGQSVVARQFDSAGVAQTDERLLSETTAGNQVAPSVAVAVDGQWITAWSSLSATSGYEAYTRTFEADGTASAESLVGVGGAGSGAVATVAVNGEDALVVWSGSSSSDRQGVRAQRYRVTLTDDGDPVAPDLAAISDQQTEVGTPIEVTVTATDANTRDQLTFTLDTDNSPANATIEQISDTQAIVRWTPTDAEDNSTVGFRVLVTDDSQGALSDAESFSVTVSDIPLAVDLDGPDSATDTASVDFLVGDAAVQSITPQLSLAGARGNQISGAIVSLVTAPDGDAEVLSVVPAAGSGITATYDPATRRLTLTGDATTAQYEATLRTLIYNNSTDFPSGTRDIEISVQDADEVSPVATASVQIVQPDLVAFARALADANATLFGAPFDEASTEQRELFQDGGQFLSFTDATNPDRSLSDVATQNNITVLPTWVFADGSRAEGIQTLAALSALSGVAIPTSIAPTVAPIADTTLLISSPLHVPLDGYDPNGGPLTYTVESDNPDVSVELLTGNRSLRLSTQNTVEASGGDFGELTFQLFEGRAARATDRVIELAESGFYDGLSFHRIIDDFVIQGGDPNGNGTGGSDLGNFDDQFHPDLQHNRTGLLSFAKSTDDTNNSQFFITEGDNTNTLRNLDFNHTVFGLLTEGEDARAAISDVATDPNNDLPVNAVRIDRAEVFTDTENGVLLLRAADDATGSANITVTVTDQDGNSSQETFRVDVADDFTNIVAPGLGDTSNARPYLEDIPPVTGVQGQPTSFQLVATDVEGDPVSFAVQRQFGDTTPFAATVDDNGEVTVSASPSFTGEITFQVSVRRPGEPFALRFNPTNGRFDIPINDLNQVTPNDQEFGDFQLVTITVEEPAQTAGTLTPGGG